MCNCEYCNKKGHKHVTIWYTQQHTWGYTRDPPFQVVRFPLLCEDCLKKFKELDKIIFYDASEFKKHMTEDVENVYDSLMSNVDECEYLENAYEIYNNL